MSNTFAPGVVLAGCLVPLLVGSCDSSLANLFADSWHL